MSRKRIYSKPPVSWTIDTHAVVNGRHLEPGTEVSIRGVRGRFRFIRHVRTESGAEWLDFWGGPKGCEGFHSFHPERVRTVHRLRRTRAAEKEKEKA